MIKPALYIHKILKFLKWPAAFVSLLLLPSLFYQYALFFKLSLGYHIIPFIAGLIAYWLMWHFILKSPYTGSFFPVLEHELTHAFFALLTFRNIKNLAITWNSGGRIQFSGSTNWLISLSPYFFPLISIIVILTGGLFFNRSTFGFKFILGITVMYNLISHKKEIHLGQSDLRKEGFIYSFLLIPGFFLFFYGLIWAYLLNGVIGIKFFVSSAFSSLSTNLKTLIHFIF